MHLFIRLKKYRKDLIRDIFFTQKKLITVTYSLYLLHSSIEFNVTISEAFS